MAFTTQVEEAISPNPIAETSKSGIKIYLKKPFVMEDQLSAEEERKLDEYLSQLDEEELEEWNRKLHGLAFDCFECPRGETLIPYPDLNGERDTGHIVGPQGCGKTETAKTFATGYKKLTGNKILVISEKDSDALDSIMGGVVRVKPGDCKPTVTMTPIVGKDGQPTKRMQKVEEFPFDKDSFHNCLIVVDDFDDLKGDELRGVQSLIDKVLNVCRTNKVSMLVTRHKGLVGGAASKELNNVDRVVLFPKKGGAENRSMLQKYLGLKTKEVEHFLDCNKFPAAKDGNGRETHWILYNKSAPLYVMTERELFTVNHQLDRIKGKQ